MTEIKRKIPWYDLVVKDKNLKRKKRKDHSTNNTFLRFLAFCCHYIIFFSYSAFSHASNIEHTHDSNTEIHYSYDKKPENLIWEDNFNNLDSWIKQESMAGGDHQEFQYFTSDARASWVSNGVLVIKPGLFPDLYDNYNEGLGIMNGSSNKPFDIISRGCDPNGRLNKLHSGCRKKSTPKHYLNPVYSAKLMSRGKKHFRYGRFEFRAKLSRGDWLWPSLWMVPVNNTYGVWPRSGAIDVAQARGNSPSYRVKNASAGIDTLFSGLHFGPIDQSHDVHIRSEKTLDKTKDFSQAFHIFGVVWDPKYIYTYYIDPDDPLQKEKLMVYEKFDSNLWEKYFYNYEPESNPWRGAATNAPFDRDFHIVLSVVCGGTLLNDSWWGDTFWKDIPRQKQFKAFWDRKNEWYPSWENSSGLQVDWIRVWKKEEIVTNTTLWKVLFVCGIATLLLCIAAGIYYCFQQRITSHSKFISPNMETAYTTVNEYSSSNHMCVYLSKDPDLDKYRIPSSKIMLIQVVSQGAYGVVWKGKYCSRTVAVKKILGDRVNKYEIFQFIEEIRLMSSLSHPNIVKFLGVMWSNTYDLSAVTEFVGGGDLQTILSNQKLKLTWVKEKLSLATDIAAGLLYLHRQNIIHRDLKSKNVLVTLDEFRAKISDFGLSRKRNVDETMTSGIGTLLWTAPEIIRGDRYSEKADIYSLGVLLSEIDTRKLPYDDVRGDSTKSGIAIAHLVATGKLVPRISDNLPETLQNLMKLCFSFDPQDRPSAGEIVNLLYGAIREEFQKTQ